MPLRYPTGEGVKTPHPVCLQTTFPSWGKAYIKNLPLIRTAEKDLSLEKTPNRVKLAVFSSYHFTISKNDDIMFCDICYTSAERKSL
jgi:hypothetical protein